MGERRATELRRVGPGVHDRTRVDDALDGWIGAFRHDICERSAPQGVRLTGDSAELLDRDWQPVQGPRPAPRSRSVTLFGGTGGLQRLLEVGEGEGVDLRLDHLGPAHEHAEVLDR